MIIEPLLQVTYRSDVGLPKVSDEAAPPRAAAHRPRVVIVGSGFGGLSAARALGNRDVDVLILSRASYHGFWMMLYQVAAAQLEPEAIASPVRTLLRHYRNTQFQVATVRGVDLERRLVLTTDQEIPYDYLVLAAGSTTNYFGNDHYSAHTHSIHDLDEAARLRDQVLAAFEQAAREPDPARRAALMTIAIVGGGPTGVELAGAFAELIGGTLAKDYPALEVRAARVVLVDGGSMILNTFPAGLQRSARRKLDRLGVELRLGSAVTSIDTERLWLADGSTIAAHTIVWAAGVRAVPLADALGVALGRGARVRVEPTLNLPGHPEVYAIGDMAYLEGYHGAAYPMVAQVALQMGKRAGRNILALAAGKEPRPFHYVDIGQMAMVGHGAALFDSFGMRLAGVLGWLIWLGVHLVNLPGMRNRLAVLLNWLYTIVTGEAAVRAPMAGDSPAPSEGATVARPAPTWAVQHARDGAHRRHKRPRAA
ncbi:MAG: NAD(P)/FAD-dependent oxidoreductase [Kouleothrix sp.]|nr:NAD(P)/FAD-dependent oxidoreductase [Kouleothrix sp.]